MHYGGNMNNDTSYYQRITERGKNVMWECGHYRNLSWEVIAKPSLEEGIAVTCMNRAQGMDGCFRQRH